MTKPLVFQIRDPLYDFKVVFVIGDRVGDNFLARVCKRYGLWNGEGKSPTCGPGYACCNNFEGGCLVWLPKTTNPAFLQHYTHELVHVLANLSHRIGCYLDKNTDECHAYYAGWLTAMMLRRIRKK